ncbi:class I SAM-dependent methyltransferase [Streptomyces sp. NPDC021224]|uniref:class I SAM-dependent methyltransferase n=1 Tax=unclassified Streptomyces TaxID=2593676 RepID=UPI0037913640
MSRPYDDERLAAAYDRGNGMPERSPRAWVELIASLAPRPAPAIVEVGAGTGVFSAAMARWIEGSTVLAGDPSDAMPAQARQHRTHPAVRYAAGSAEAVPAPAGAFGLALLSRVIHHLPDRPRAVTEPARIVRTGGRVVVRTTFRERLDSVVYDHWQFRAGLVSLEAAARGAGAGPVAERHDVAVFSRS